MSNLITPIALKSIIDRGDVLIADCRFELSDPDRGRAAYLAGHIPGAVYIQLNQDLSDPLSDRSGRHPLPTIEDMEARFGRMGISSGMTSVIVYDDAGGSFAARMWWMLRYLGHENVRLLDGGLQAWMNDIGTVTHELAVSRPPAKFISRVKRQMLVRMDRIQTEAQGNSLVDARTNERYRGDVEPIDRVAGHIPRAINIPWTRNLDVDGRFLSPQRLREVYLDLLGEPVMYCGSGVTSCLNVLAMEEAGLPLPRLYAGSWSEWISSPTNQIALGG